MNTNRNVATQAKHSWYNNATHLHLSQTEG